MVDLSPAVAGAVRLDPATRRDIEFAALLHDVGKIRVPKEIINKPGKLDQSELELIQRHTIDGEQVLKQVGGTLASVGRIVRSSHERYDGQGYPDGLAGGRIPNRVADHLGLRRVQRDHHRPAVPCRANH